MSVPTQFVWCSNTRCWVPREGSFLSFSTQLTISDPDSLPRNDQEMTEGRGAHTADLQRHWQIPGGQHLNHADGTPIPQICGMLEEMTIERPYSSLDRELQWLIQQFCRGQLCTEAQASVCLARIISASEGLRAWADPERRSRVDRLVSSAESHREILALQCHRHLFPNRPEPDVQKLASFQVLSESVA